MNRFFGNGLYILDEPEAALSPQRLLAFLVRMHELVQNQSQFIIATHSPIILSYPYAKIIDLHPSGNRTIQFQETEHFAIYKTFLNDPQTMLKRLDIQLP